MSDREVFAAVRAVLAAGQGHQLIVELLDRGTYNPEERGEIRSAFVRACVRDVGSRYATVRFSGGTTQRTHLWVPRDGSFGTVCGLASAARTAEELVDAIRQGYADRLAFRHFFHSCGECARRLPTISNLGAKVVTLGALAALTETPLNDLEVWTGPVSAGQGESGEEEEA